jgi:hypothetical protein
MQVTKLSRQKGRYLKKKKRKSTGLRILINSLRCKKIVKTIPKEFLEEKRLDTGITDSAKSGFNVQTLGSKLKIYKV